MGTMDNGNEPEFDLPEIEMIVVTRRKTTDKDGGEYKTVSVETNVDDDITRSILFTGLMCKTFDYMEAPLEDMMGLIAGDDEEDD